MPSDNDDTPEWKVENDYSFYQPLNVSKEKQIRLITIDPGATDDPVRCRLGAHTLPCEGLAFEALSYCWGALDDTVTITLCHESRPEPQGSSDGQGAVSPSPPPREQTFNVTRNLDRALRHLRRTDEPCVMWIDALCINQGSIRERNYAIPFMVDVYKAADRVVIFLGDEREGEDFSHFWDIMDMLDKAVERSGGVPLWKRPDINAEIDHLQIINNGENAPGVDSYFDVSLRLAFSAFFEYSWFQRVWVVQEAMNAKKAVVRCGDKEKDWPDILVMLHWAAKSSRSYTGGYSGRHPSDMLPPFLWTKLHAARGGKIDAPSYLPLLDLIASGRAFNSTDPRDKVFALLSFGEETHDLLNLPSPLKPDYGKTASAIWVDLTRQWIIDHRSLDILGVLREKVDKNNQVAQNTLFVGDSDEKDVDVTHAVEAPPEGHPSWALWHAEHPEAALRALFRRGEENNIQASSYELNIEALNDPDDPSVLSLPGTVLDRIESVQWPFKRWTYWTEANDDMRLFNYDRTPPKMLRSAVPTVWAAAIGALSGLDDDRAQVKFKSGVQITPYPNHTALIQAYFETLTCRPLTEVWFLPDKPMDLDREDGLDPVHRAELATIAHFAAHWAKSEEDPDMKWLPVPWAECLRPLVKHGRPEEFTRMCEFAEDRCFFKTERGAFGLCPRGTKVGDIVASLAGGKTPFVLRPTDPKKVQAKLIGECYFHGLDIKRTTAGIAKDEDGVTVLNLV